MQKNKKIKYIIKRIKFTIEERKNVICKELLNENLDKKTLEYFYI